MTALREELQRLQQEIIEKEMLDTRLKKLDEQRKRLEENAAEMERQMFREEEDVKKLETLTLSACFYSIFGKKRERLEQEKAEAYAARLRYDAAFGELSQINEEIRDKTLKRGRLAGCEERYQKALDRQREELRRSGGPKAQEIIELEERLGKLKGEKKELSEAIVSGRRAMELGNQILSKLDSAQSWGTWDLVGGGLVSDMVKHSHLDEAQRQVMALQRELRQFQTELADVDISADMQVNVDGFLRFADYFFDGIIADWAVLDKISASRRQVEITMTQVRQIAGRLEALRTEAERKEREEKGRLDQLLME